MRSVIIRCDYGRDMTETSGVVIRTATADDLEALADIYVSSARHHVALDPDLYVVPEPEAVAKHLRETLDLDHEKSVRLVADVGGRVVGSASIELRRPSPASMLRPVLGAWVGVAVLEGQRGDGIGSRLMQAAEQWARKHGAALMMLDASVANLDALRFYEQRHGYRRTGVLMRKPIDPVD